MDFDEQYFLRLNRALLSVFGVPERRCEDDITGALVRGILSQNTNDKNRDRAFNSLREKFPSWELVAEADEQQIASAIRVAGMANQRAKRIKNLLSWLKEMSDGRIDAKFLLDMPYESSLALLTSVQGIGLKTAAVFLLFCANAPVFPVDTHIKRIMVRLGVFPQNKSANYMIKVLSRKIPQEIHYTLHINLIKLGRSYCGARRKLCEECPVRKMCASGKAL